MFTYTYILIIAYNKEWIKKNTTAFIYFLILLYPVSMSRLSRIYWRHSHKKMTRHTLKNITLLISQLGKKEPNFETINKEQTHITERRICIVNLKKTFINNHR